MSDLANSWASFHFRLGPRMTVTLHLKGADSDKEICPVDTTIAQGELLVKFAQAVKRLHTVEDTSKEPA